MQVIGLGAGAIGSLFGAKLALAGNDVTLIGRVDHVAAMKADGLRVHGLEEHTIRVRAATAVAHLEPDTLILLTTKVPATRAALTPLAPLVRDDTTILSLQNGLGSETVARDALNNRGVVLRGLTQAGAIFEGPGTVRYTVSGYTLIEQHERSAAIADLFNAAHLECGISSNIADDVWRKLIYNCVVNPITAIIGREVGAIADAAFNPLKQLVIDECLAVAAREGVTFQTDFLHEIDEVFAGSPNIVSMLQDIRRGRPTEIDYMNGAVVSLGEKHGLACPANAGLTSIIKALERQAQASFVPEKMLES